MTTIDTGSIALREGVFRDERLLLGGAATVKAGTILARLLVAAAITVTPDGGNTGTRVITASARPGRVLQVGTYTLEAGTLSSGVGTWTLTAPDGWKETYTTAAAGEDMVFGALGVAVTIADSGTNFVTGDDATLLTTAQSGTPLVPFSPTGVGGAAEPLGVLTYEVTAEEAGSLSIRAMVGGIVKEERLVIHADGDGDNITPAILDKLRRAGVQAVSVQQLSA